MHYFIITGTSRGIGAALARQLLSPKHTLFCISRGDNPALRSQAKEAGCALLYKQADLSDTTEAQLVFHAIMQQVDSAQAASITLIHNAAALAPMNAIGKKDDKTGIVQAVQLNLTMPLVLTAMFVKHVQDWPIIKRVLNISSGAAKRPVHAWSTYCSTKAGLDMYSRCLALEQATELHPIKVLALAPGVVDTAMQDFIREQPKEVFHGVDRFLKLKSENRLWSPEFVAEQIYKLLKEDSFGEPVLQDLRDIVAQ